MEEICLLFFTFLTKVCPGLVCGSLGSGSWGSAALWDVDRFVSGLLCRCHPSRCRAP